MHKRIRFEAFISGIVQGVSFRFYTRRKALIIGVKGYVKNLQDGRVYVVAEGIENNISEFLRWLHTGPSGARVEDVEIIQSDFQNEFDTFDIRF